MWALPALMALAPPPTVKKEVYNWDGVERVVTEALAHGNKVVINADW